MAVNIPAIARVIISSESVKARQKTRIPIFGINIRFNGTMYLPLVPMIGLF